MLIALGMTCFYARLISQLIGLLNEHEDSVRYISKLENGNIISASCDKTISHWKLFNKKYMKHL